MNRKNELLFKLSSIISQETATENCLNELKEVLILYLDITDQKIDNIIDLIEYVGNDRTQQEFLSAVFLRFYKNHEDIIESDKRLKHKIISLFDLIYEHDIYKKRKLTSRMQSHEKLPILKQHVEELEELIHGLTLIDLKSFNAYRNNYLKLLGGNEKIIKSFLQQDIYREISTILNNLEEYIKTSCIDKYNKLKKALDQAIDKLEIIDTEYNNLFLLKPLLNIREIIGQELVNNPDAKISTLIISSTGKRYPLDVIDAHIDLFIKLTNVEDGKAYDTEIEIINANNLDVNIKKQYIGTIEGKKKVRIKFDAIVKESMKILFVKVKIKWKDFQQKQYNASKILKFFRQRTDIDWEEFEENEFYSREAIDSENELIGRKDILDELYKGLDKNKNIKSYCIHGQKRVGKTSIAKVLKERLSSNKDKFLVLYIEGGEYVDGENFKNTINNLGNKICRQILRANPKLSHLNIPPFDGSLTPLVDFLDDVENILSDLKIIFILDEFDEISSNLYKRNETGNAFFLTIRSISNKKNYSFILIGGEKINFIISTQGEQLNKFKSHRVDYFDKAHWSEFKDLVKVPVEDYLDITDAAINKLYEQTAGNPFFTNVICEVIIERAIKKRDSFITDIEVEEAIKQSIEDAETQIFSHFWEDGIKEDNDKEEEVSFKRRKVLLVLADLEKKGEILSGSQVRDKLIGEFPEDEIKKILTEFVDRNILNENNDTYSFRINFFKRWLADKGAKEIIMTLSDEEQIQIRKRREKEAEVTSTHLKSFIDSKNIIYRGVSLTTDDVRNWLLQFDTNINQRLIFKILDSLVYYSSANIKVKMKEIFSHIKEKKYQGKTKVSNVLVSYLDAPGKSGVEYLKYFIEENSILAKNGVEKDKVLEKLKSEEFKYLVFVDDFLGTGKTIIDHIKDLNSKYPEIFTIDVNIIIGVVTGFLDAKEKVEKELEKLKINNISILLCQPLNDSNKCFSESSKTFSNPDERKDARDICWEKGYELVKSDPLGFGDCQTNIIFPDTSPNNNLPILWAENEQFKPLFKRTIN